MLGRKPLQLADAEIFARYYNGESLTAIAKNIGVGRSTVTRRLLACGLPIRNAVEATRLRCFKHIDNQLGLIELIDGLLLGDGTIEKDNFSEGRLSVEQTEKNKEWLLSIEIEMQHLDIKCSISYRKPRISHLNGNEVNSKATYIIRTGKYVNFSEQKIRWYKNGIKLVPRDVIITPKVLALWYCGDGSITQKGYRPVLYTDSFTVEDVEFLIDRLRTDCNIKARIGKHGSKPIITIGTSSERKKLIDIVRDYMPECFKYKLEIKQ